MPKPLDSSRWDDLRFFLAVVRAGSFSGAAENLGVEQSTVSRRVAQLEAELGHNLFDRQATGPRPTDLAALLREPAERIESEMRAIRDLAAGHSAAIEGRVRLALTESFAVHVFVPHMLSELRALHPGLAIDLVLGTRAADLVQREADLALRFFRPSEGDLVTKRVASFSTAVLAHRGYAQGRPSDAEALDWIVLELESAFSPDGAYVSKHVRREPAMRVTSHLVQVEAVRAGHGVALLARAHMRLDPELLELDLGLPHGPAIDVWLAAPRTLKPIPRVSAVWDFLAARLPSLETDA
jgi:DNA-binding transcriptional LysR family regulator